MGPDDARCLHFAPMETIILPAALLGSYLVGSLSFAVLISRMMGLEDPRTYGSGNPGATNVLRSGNRKAAALTLLFDALKGVVPVLLAARAAPALGWGDAQVAAVGLAAFLGHLWPIFFRFQGGKGVATAAGVLLAFEPMLGLATMASWLLIAWFFRYSSLAALVSAAFAPFYHALIWGADAATLCILIMSALLIGRHAGNIRKLLAGQESRIGQKAGNADEAAAPSPASPEP